MVASVASIAIAFDPDDDLGMTPQPIGLRTEDRSRRYAEADILGAEIDCRSTRLGRKLGALRVDTD